MKILILGGSGFVGTRLTEILLKDNYQVTIGDLVKSEKYPELWRQCDVCVDEELRQIMSGQDCVVNLAASHRDDVRPLSLYTRNNVEGAEHVCKIASEVGVRHIVFTSSVAVYGFPEYAYDENGPKHPFNEYGRTKLLAEGVYEKWQKADPANMLHVVRPTVIFGERNRGNVYNLFRQLASGRFLMVGNGRNKKSMAYVGNIVAFLKWNIEENKAGYSVYNYIDKPDFNMNDLVAGFENALGRKLPSIRLPYWLGLLGGYCFDLLAFLTRRTFPVSSIRVKKFCAQTMFSSERWETIPPELNGEMSAADLKTLNDNFLFRYAWNKIYRREFLVKNDIWFESGTEPCEDAIFNLKCVKAGARWQSVQDVGYVYWKRLGSSLFRYCPTIEKACRRENELWESFNTEARIPRAQASCEAGAKGVRHRDVAKGDEREEIYGWGENEIAAKVWDNRWLKGSPEKNPPLKWRVRQFALLARRLLRFVGV